VKRPFHDLTPSFTQQREEILAAARRVLEGGWYILGPEVEAFEQEFARFLQEGVPGSGGSTIFIPASVNAVGSYGYNFWFGNQMRMLQASGGFGAAPTESFLVESDIQNPSATPVVADAVAVTFGPRASDRPPSNLRQPESGGMGTVAIPRHGSWRTRQSRSVGELLAAEGEEEQNSSQYAAPNADEIERSGVRSAGSSNIVATAQLSCRSALRFSAVRPYVVRRIQS
jgi:hypothetical protein